MSKNAVWMLYLFVGDISAIIFLTSATYGSAEQLQSYIAAPPCLTGYWVISLISEAV